MSPLNKVYGISPQAFGLWYITKEYRYMVYLHRIYDMEYISAVSSYRIQVYGLSPRTPAYDMSQEDIISPQKTGLLYVDNACCKTTNSNKHTQISHHLLNCGPLMYLPQLARLCQLRIIVMHLYEVVPEHHVSYRPYITTHLCHKTSLIRLVVISFLMILTFLLFYLCDQEKSGQICTIFSVLQWCGEAACGDKWWLYCACHLVIPTRHTVIRRHFKDHTKTHHLLFSLSTTIDGHDFEEWSSTFPWHPGNLMSGNCSSLYHTSQRHAIAKRVKGTTTSPPILKSQLTSTLRAII